MALRPRHTAAGTDIGSRVSALERTVSPHTPPWTQGSAGVEGPQHIPGGLPAAGPGYQHPMTLSGALRAPRE